MDPADAFAQLKSEIRRLEDRAQVLRDDFVKPGMRLRSNRFEVTSASADPAGVSERSPAARSAE